MNIFKVDPKLTIRAEIQEVIPVLSSVLEKIRKNPNIEVSWKKFHSENTALSKSKIRNNQASRDVFKEVNTLNFAIPDQMATGGTILHDQKYSNLCVFFTTMSVLRHQLRKTVGDRNSQYDHTRDDNKYEGLKIKEYIKKKDVDDNLFERQLMVMVACVSPRSLAVKFKNNLIQIQYPNFFKDVEFYKL